MKYDFMRVQCVLFLEKLFARTGNKISLRKCRCIQNHISEEHKICQASLISIKQLVCEL